MSDIAIQVARCRSFATTPARASGQKSEAEHTMLPGKKVTEGTIRRNVWKVRARYWAMRRWRRCGSGHSFTIAASSPLLRRIALPSSVTMTRTGWTWDDQRRASSMKIRSLRSNWRPVRTWRRCRPVRATTTLCEQHSLDHTRVRCRVLAHGAAASIGAHPSQGVGVVL